MKKALKVRNIIARYSAPSELHGAYVLVQGATRLALLGACPWLLYCAPLALRRLTWSNEQHAFAAAEYSRYATGH